MFLLQAPEVDGRKTATKKTDPKQSLNLNLDPSLLEKLFVQSRMDTINVDYEWFNYTLAQFWHTYEGWLGQYIRMIIETSIGSISFLKLETCTLGQVLDMALLFLISS